MKIKRIIDGKPVEIELTSEELDQAWNARAHEIMMGECRDAINDYDDEELIEKFSVTRETALDHDNLSSLASDVSLFINEDEDLECSVPYAVECVAKKSFEGIDSDEKLQHALDVIHCQDFIDSYTEEEFGRFFWASKKDAMENLEAIAKEVRHQMETSHFDEGYAMQCVFSEYLSEYIKEQ